MGEAGEPDWESALSSPAAPEPPLLKVESIRRRPKLTRLIQLKPPFLCFRCFYFVFCFCWDFCFWEDAQEFWFEGFHTEDMERENK